MTSIAAEAQHPTSGDLWGTVVAVQANFYSVRLDPAPQGGQWSVSHLLCTRRARLKKSGSASDGGRSRAS